MQGRALLNKPEGLCAHAIDVNARWECTNEFPPGNFASSPEPALRQGKDGGETADSRTGQDFGAGASNAPLIRAWSSNSAVSFGVEKT